MAVPVKKSTGGSMIAFGPIAVRVCYTDKGLRTWAESVNDGSSYKFDLMLLDVLNTKLNDKSWNRPGEVDPLTGEEPVQDRARLIAITSPDQKELSRLFKGVIEEKDGHKYLIIDRTLNLDRKMNPDLHTEILDEPLRIELTPSGTIRQADVDRLQDLVRSGKLVQAGSLRRNPAFDALLAAGPAASENPTVAITRPASTPRMPKDGQRDQAL